jgi:hypothetical protein
VNAPPVWEKHGGQEQQEGFSEVSTKLHLVDVYTAMAMIWKFTPKSLTVD